MHETSSMKTPNKNTPLTHCLDSGYMYLYIRVQRPEYRKVDVGQTTTENASNQLPLVEFIATRICCVRMKNRVVRLKPTLTHRSRTRRSSSPFVKPIPANVLTSLSSKKTHRHTRIVRLTTTAFPRNVVFVPRLDRVVECFWKYWKNLNISRNYTILL